MKMIWELIKREFRLFNNNKVLRILFIGAPILYGVLIGNVYKKGKVTNLPIIVVDEDRSPMSSKLIDMFNESEVIYVSDILNDNFNSRQLALEREATVVVQIPKGFMASVSQNRQTEVAVFVDASNTLTSNYAMLAVNVCAATMKAGIQIETQKKKGVPGYIASQQYEPFKTTIIKQNIRSGNYLYFMLPGVLMTVFQQILLLGLALSFASEFENNTFSQLLSKTSNPFTLIFVKVFPYFLMSIGVMALYYGFSVFYKMPIQVEIWPFLLSTTLFILAASFIGILVSIAIPNQLKATEILMVIATPSFILSGFTWPLSQMPHWVQVLSDVIPLTHYLQIFRLLFIEQAPAYLIHKPMIALTIIMLICFLLSVLLLYLKIRKIKKQKSVTTAV
ncbi:MULTISPECIES: ABC transporter permease [Sphingobacterium]|uniref:ABC transporter permease n=1 Tax=Sphingobacterium TaxID=28453 RepID=UPI001918C330|nr:MULTISPECIES: ABC transporter permease [Sphingobacterium]QQT26760.1 ABC transporter permease [Sphingobacterium spiritivorum]